MPAADTSTAATARCRTRTAAFVRCAGDCGTQRSFTHGACTRPGSPEAGPEAATCTGTKNGQVHENGGGRRSSGSGIARGCSREEEGLHRHGGASVGRAQVRRHVELVAARRRRMAHDTADSRLFVASTDTDSVPVPVRRVVRAQRPPAAGSAAILLWAPRRRCDGTSLVAIVL